MPKDYSREAATITSALIGKEPDRGFECVSIMCEGEGWGQGFTMSVGNFLESARSAILKTFGVKSTEQLIGKKCYCLRSFNTHGADIEGLEAESGKRFLRSVWARSVNPNSEPILVYKKKGILASIESHKNAIARGIVELEAIDASFIDWEKSNNVGI